MAEHATDAQPSAPGILKPGDEYVVSDPDAHVYIASNQAIPDPAKPFAETVATDAPVIVARAHFIPPKAVHILRMLPDDLVERVSRPETAAPRRGSREAALALTNTGLFLRREIEKRLPPSAELTEVATHLEALFTHSKDVPYNPESLQRKKETKTFFDKTTGTKETYTASSPGPVEQACILIVQTAREKTWGSDLSRSMLSMVDTLLTKYRLQSQDTPQEFTPDLPDLSRELMTTLESLDDRKGIAYLSRRKIYSIFDQMPIQESLVERTLQIMDLDERDLDHPFAMYATMHLTENAPDSPWVYEQRRRRLELINILVDTPVEKLFSMYDELSEVAHHIVLQPGSGTAITGKVGMEFECSLTLDTGNDELTHGWRDVVGGGTQEIRRQDNALKYDTSYIRSLVTLSHFMRDRGVHLQGFHFHLDRDTHPSIPDIGKLLIALDEGHERDAIRMNPLGTWEVRAIWPPSISWNQARPNPADIVHLVNLHILASSPPRFQYATNPFHLEEGNTPTLHQLIFGHIIRNLEDPEAKFAALMALKHRHALNSVDAVTIALNFDESSRVQALSSMLHSDIRHDQKIACLRELFQPGIPPDEKRSAIATDILRSLYTKELPILLEYFEKKAKAPAALQTALWDLLETGIREANRIKQELPHAEGNTEDALKYQDGYITNVILRLQKVLGAYADPTVSDVPRILSFLQNHETAQDIADIVSKWKFTDVSVESILFVLENPDPEIRNAAGKILSGRNFTDNQLQFMIDLTLKDPTVVESVGHILRNTPLPEKFRDHFVGLTDTGHDAKIRKAAAKALYKTPLSEQQRNRLIGNLDTHDAEINRQIMSILNKSKATDVEFTMLVDATRKIASRSGGEMLNIFISGLTAQDPSNESRQALIAGLFRDADVNVSYIAYSALGQAGILAPSVITQLADMTPAVSRDTLACITQMLTEQAVKTEGEIPEFFDRLLADGNSDVICGILSAFSRMEEPISPVISARLKKLVKHPDLRVQYALVMLSRQAFFTDIYEPSDVLTLLRSIDREPEKTSESAIELRRIETIRTDREPDESESTGNPFTTQPEKEMTMRNKDFVEPYSRDFEERIPDRTLNANMLSNGRLEKMNTADSYREAEKLRRMVQSVELGRGLAPAVKAPPDRYRVSAPQFDLIMSQIHVPTSVTARMVRSALVSDVLKKARQLTEPQTLELLHLYGKDEYQSNSDELLQTVLKQDNLPDSALPILTDIFATDTRHAWYFESDVLGRKNPSRAYHDFVWSRYDASDTKGKIAILQYEAKHPNLPESVIASLETVIHGTDHYLISGAYQALLRQPILSDGILTGLMEFFESESYDLGPQMNAVEALKYQHALPENILLWTIPNDFTQRSSVSDRVVRDILASQLSLSNAVYEKLFHSYVRSTDMSVERLTAFFNTQTKLPPQIIRTMLSYAENRESPRLKKGYVFEFLIGQEHLPEDVIERIFAHTENLYQPPKKLIEKLAPMIRSQYVLLRCLEPYTHDSTPATDRVFRELKRFTRYPQAFIHRCIDSYATYSRYAQEEFLDFLTVQEQLSESVLEAIAKLPVSEKSQAFRYREYISWKFSKNPVKSMIARVKGPERFNFVSKT